MSASPVPAVRVPYSNRTVYPMSTSVMLAFTARHFSQCAGLRARRLGQRQEAIDRT